MADAFPISGNIDPKAFPFLLVDLHRHGATGSLKVKGPSPEGPLLPRRPRALRLVERPARPAGRDPDRERQDHARAARGRERQGRARQPAREGAGRQRLREPARAGRGGARQGRAHPLRRAVLRLGQLRVRGRRAAEGRRRPQALDREAGARRRPAQSATGPSCCATSSCSSVLEPSLDGETALAEVRADVWPLLEQLDGSARSRTRPRSRGSTSSRPRRSPARCCSWASCARRRSARQARSSTSPSRPRAASARKTRRCTRCRSRPWPWRTCRRRAASPSPTPRPAIPCRSRSPRPSAAARPSRRRRSRTSPSPRSSPSPTSTSLPSSRPRPRCFQAPRPSSRWPTT